MKKYILGTVLGAAVLTAGAGIQTFASGDETGTADLQPDFQEIQPYMEDAFLEKSEEELEEFYNERRAEGVRGPRSERSWFGGGFGPGMMGGFGPGACTNAEFEDVKDYMGEIFPEMSEEELEEFYNERQSERSTRGPGMMRGGFGPGNGPGNGPGFNGTDGESFQPGSGPRWNQ